MVTNLNIITFHGNKKDPR